MDVSIPSIAQQVVAAYLRVVEQHAGAEIYPAALRDLPYPKETIRDAFRTSVTALVASQQLTPGLRDYLEIGYVSLADYLEDDVAALLREYNQSGRELADDTRPTKEKVTTDSWKRVSEQSKLAGEIARSVQVEADALRAEFRAWHLNGSGGRAAPTANGGTH
jgi:hypothetical protein